MKGSTYNDCAKIVLIYALKKMCKWQEWDKFKEETKQFYDVSMDVLEDHYDREQKEYSIQAALWFELLPEHVVSTPVIIKRLDLHTCTLQV